MGHLGRLRVRDHRTLKTVTTPRAPYWVKDVTTRKSSTHLPGRMSSPSRARQTALRPTRAIWDKRNFEFIEEMFNLNKFMVS